MLYESFFDPGNAFWWFPRLPQAQIWTQSWNLKNCHFHHFLWSLSWVLVRSRNGLSRIPWGSPFACAHQNAWSFRENLQKPRRPAKNMRTLKNWPPNYSKCHFSWNLRLAVPCRRITLQSLWNMLYESFFDARNAFWWSLGLPSLKSGPKLEI